MLVTDSTCDTCKLITKNINIDQILVVQEPAPMWGTFSRAHGTHTMCTAALLPPARALRSDWPCFLP